MRQLLLEDKVVTMKTTVKRVRDTIALHCRSQGILCNHPDRCIGRHCEDWSIRNLCPNCHKEGWI